GEPGVVDQDVEWSCNIQCRLGELMGLLQILEIGGSSGNRRAVFLQFSNGALDIFLLATADEHISTITCQPFGHRATKPTCASGDQGTLVRESGSRRHQRFLHKIRSSIAFYARCAGNGLTSIAPIMMITLRI